MTDSSALRRYTDFESADEDGIIQLRPGHPGYCPVEQVHDQHRFEYAYLDRNDQPVRGAYWCFGDPAPWAPSNRS